MRRYNNEVIRTVRGSRGLFGNVTPISAHYPLISVDIITLLFADVCYFNVPNVYIMLGRVSYTYIYEYISTYKDTNFSCPGWMSLEVLR